MRKLLCLVFVLAGCGLAHADTKHVVDTGKTTYGPTTVSKFDQGVEDYAQDLRKKYGQAGQRMASHDMAMPLDAREYAAMGKYGVVLVSAISHNPKELPLSRVYMRIDDRDVELKRVMSVRRQTPEGSATREMFGAYREYAFYLVPVELVTKSTLLFCDFAANRKAFQISQLDDPEPAFIASDHDRTPGKVPSTAVLKAFIAREYPGILSPH